MAYFDSYVYPQTTSSYCYDTSNLVQIYHNDRSINIGNKTAIVIEHDIVSIRANELLVATMGNKCHIFDIDITSPEDFTIIKDHKLTLYQDTTEVYAKRFNGHFLVMYKVNNGIYTCATNNPSVHYYNGEVRWISETADIIVDYNYNIYQLDGPGNFRYVAKCPYNISPNYNVLGHDVFWFGKHISSLVDNKCLVHNHNILLCFYYRNLLIMLDDQHQAFLVGEINPKYISTYDRILQIYDTKYRKYSKYCSIDGYLLYIE